MSEKLIAVRSNHFSVCRENLNKFISEQFGIKFNIAEVECFDYDTVFRMKVAKKELSWLILKDMHDTIKNDELSDSKITRALLITLCNKGIIEEGLYEIIPC